MRRARWITVSLGALLLGGAVLAGTWLTGHMDALVAQTDAWERANYVCSPTTQLDGVVIPAGCAYPDATFGPANNAIRRTHDGMNAQVWAEVAGLMLIVFNSQVARAAVLPTPLARELQHRAAEKAAQEATP